MNNIKKINVICSLCGKSKSAPEKFCPCEVKPKHTDKMLEEFDEMFHWTDFDGGIGTYILSKKTSRYGTEETERNELRAFLTSKIYQAIAEERERVADKILDIIQNIDWIEKPRSAFGSLNDLLASLDKTIDKPKSVWGDSGGGYMMGPGSILDLSGGGSGYGTCGNCGGVVDDGYAPQGKRKCRYGASNCRD